MQKDETPIFVREEEVVDEEEVVEGEKGKRSRFWGRRGLSFLGSVVCVTVGVFLVVSFLSSSQGDISLNSYSTEGGVENWMGYGGAVVADIFLQTLGLVSFLFVSVVWGWGWRLYREGVVRHFLWRVIVLIPSLLLWGYSFDGVLWGYGVVDLPARAGGAVGYLMKGYGEVFFAEIGVYRDMGVVVVAFLGFLYSFALTWGEWREVMERLLGGVTWLLSRLGSLFGSLFGSLGVRMGARKEVRKERGVGKEGVVDKAEEGREEEECRNEPMWAREEVQEEPQEVQEEQEVEEEVQEEPQEVQEEQEEQEKSQTVLEEEISFEEEGEGESPVVVPVRAEEPVIFARREEQKPKVVAREEVVKEEGRLPSLSLLNEVGEVGLGGAVSEEEQRDVSERLLKVLQDFGVHGDIKTKPKTGPVVTLYEFEPAPGTRTRKVTDLSEDVARSMSVYSVRMATLPGRNSIAIEIPNGERQMVKFRSLLESREYRENDMKLPLVLGCDIGGKPEVVDLATMPHLLIAGTTGSGKSVGLNVMIMSLLYRYGPSKCRFIMIDPKMLELSVYKDIPHLLTPVVTDAKKAVVALKWAVREMEQRYWLMSQVGVRNIENYNKKVEKLGGEPFCRKVHEGFDEDGVVIEREEEIEMRLFPYIVVIVDEMADLMLVAGKDIESLIQRLAQMARAAGIHLVMATQRPSVDVVTGTIKANFPTRISFMVSSKIDSRTVLGEQGAEQLLGKGDMLLMSGGGRLHRIHGPFVEDEEVVSVCDFLKLQGSPLYEKEVTKEIVKEEGGEGEGGENDPLFDRAVELVASSRKASTSFLQRQLQVGYNRAARLMEEMEEAGMVSEPDHVGKREVLLPEREV